MIWQLEFIILFLVVVCAIGALLVRELHDVSALGHHGGSGCGFY